MPLTVPTLEGLLCLSQWAPQSKYYYQELEHRRTTGREPAHPSYAAELEKYDVNYFSETHWVPSQELTVPIPPGYEIFAVAREPSPTFEKQWGGVAAIVRSDLKAVLDEVLCGPDLLVLKIGALCLFNAYVLLHNSP
ncbi:hypothetical protein B0H17DRAFT_1132439 [Mycena rosella]|uniref:Uncharacterized protein n=1 Tax=Mycena rosella TaxID=1033263 RepID=A0AAD7DK77_MYCRO|nr:hypothetical protein B0H17DRAFT_1132439 [Mycena rosella]